MQELEATVSSAENDSVSGEIELKRQELNDAKLLVEDVTQQLKSETLDLLHWITICQVLIFCLCSDYIVLFLRNFWPHWWADEGA